MILIFRLLLIFSLGFGANYFQPNLQLYTGNLNIPDTLRLVGIMVQFQLENPDNSKTSGDGHFLNSGHEQYNNFYDSTSPRCDGFLVDRPPHNSIYFRKQLEAVGNYYHNISGEKLSYTANIVTNSNSPENGYYTVSDEMEYYAKSDQLLAELFTEVLNSARVDIESYLTNQEISSDSVVFVVFHAGLGQDFSLPGLDPTIYDLKSAYIDEDMMEDVTPAEISGNAIMSGVLLPETQNIIYFDIVEDIFGNPDDGIDDLCDIQLGLTGIFAFLLGYELGLPPMFNTDTGDPGIGFFGLMDHGSNNGQGVIPAPPSPWTRIIAGWLDPIVIDPYDGLDTNITIPALDIANQVYQIKISSDEYFLVENRNNHIISSFDIEYLQRLLWDDYLCNNCDLNCNTFNITEIVNNKLVIEDCVKSHPFSNEGFHYFDMVDSLIKHDQLVIINGELENNIFTNFTNYDYGLPGSGILIWHIKEPDPFTYNLGVNNDLENRHIQIEEADGAVDIGFESYTFFASDAVNIGWRYDYWFSNNTAYLTDGNPNAEEVVFNNWSAPNTRTTTGAESFLSIKILGDTLYTEVGDTIYTSISDHMNINIQFNGGITDEKIDIVILSDELVQYLGNSVENNTGFVFYAKGDSIYRQSNGSGASVIAGYNSSSDNYIFTYEDSLYITDNQYFWFDTVGTGHTEYKTPMGYITENDYPDTVHFSLAPSDSSLSFGDIDQDGLDEIITIDEDGNIIVKNNNGTLVNGFPTDGDFSGIPLIANILPPKYGSDVGKPEIVCREGNDIVILSAGGERLRQLSSLDIDQPLAMVPYWDGKMALIDGSRLFLFKLDMDHSYWLNPRSRSSGFPMSTGTHESPSNLNLDHKNAYNYPNPITDGSTTFRFYVSSSKIFGTQVQIKIYNAAGYLIDDFYNSSDLTYYEFNEILWDASQVDAGLYFAEIKPDIGSSELVKLVVIK